MRYAAYLILLLLLTANVQAQGEFNLNIKNGILLNKADQTRYSGLPVTNMHNTFQQSIGAAYTYVNKLGVLYTAGADVGYEKYSAGLLYPARVGVTTPFVLEDNYKLKATIPYARINIGVGYRLKRSPWQPEFRLT
ncbi:MAG: hypothetical protein EOP51_06910 [Sphingobacteriales bacterium]|nr:MAG: hypothetical protein EOP51_06910 [Sphingobacteriales bacterium]